QLRLAIEHNIRDFDSPEQIVYMVDANIIHLFLNPYFNSINASPFKDILGQEQERLSMSSAVITAEYIFSRLLARQHEYPAFVAEEYVEEVTGYLGRLRQDIDAARSIPQSDTDKQSWRRGADSLLDLRDKVSDRSNDGSELRELFEQRIPDAIAS